MDNEQILISDAGIAGLTAAYWLSRFGFRPTVVEQAPGLCDQPVGAEECLGIGGEFTTPSRGGKAAAASKALCRYHIHDMPSAAHSTLSSALA